ncbi:MAG: STN domain-containing protein [Steroidobacteraceae bacterium]
MKSARHYSINTLMLGLTLWTPITALAADKHFLDIPSQPVSTALTELARQTNTQIVAPADNLQGRVTAAIKGEYDTTVALRQLIAGTALEVASANDSVIVLRNAAAVVAAKPGSPNSVPQPSASPTLVDPRRLPAAH